MPSRQTKTQCPTVNWLIVLWMKTDMHKMGNDRQMSPPLINIYMWMMRLNFASPVCAGASATRVAAQRTGHYFIWDLMSAEFIRAAGFLWMADSFLQQMGSPCCIVAEKHALYVTCLWRHLGFELENEIAGLLEYVF